MANTPTPKVKPSEDLVTEAQKASPAVPNPLDKDGPAEAIVAPGEAVAGENKVNVKATGAFLVFDPYTSDCVGEEGGEMRLTEFVQRKLDAGELAKA